MFLKTCRCGKSKKNFMMDIGAFFIDDCCIEAGYDELGNLVVSMGRRATPEEVKKVESMEVAKEVVLTTSQNQVEPEKKKRGRKKKVESEGT